MGFPEVRGLFWEPYSKDCSILGSILESPILGNYQIQLHNYKLTTMPPPRDTTTDTTAPAITDDIGVRSKKLLGLVLGCFREVL